MPTDLTQLQQLIQQAARAKGREGGLEDQLARAQALRDTPELKPAGDTGYINPLRMWNRHRDMRRGEKQATAAQQGLAQVRQQLAEAQAGQTMYGLETDAANTAWGQGHKENVLSSQERAAADKLAATQAAAKQKYQQDEAIRQDERKDPLGNAVQYQDSTTGEKFNVYRTKDGWKDGDGNPISLTGLNPVPKRTTDVLEYATGNTYIDKPFFADTTSATKLGQVAERGLSMSDASKAHMNSFGSRFTEAALDALVAKGFRPMVREMVSGDKVPREVKDFVTGLAQLSGTELNALFGASFTRGEEVRADEFAKFVKGMNYDDMMGRIITGHEDIVARIQGAQERYPVFQRAYQPSDTPFRDRWEVNLERRTADGDTTPEQRSVLRRAELKRLRAKAAGDGDGG